MELIITLIYVYLIGGAAWFFGSAVSNRLPPRVTKSIIFSGPLTWFILLVLVLLILTFSKSTDY